MTQPEGRAVVYAAIDRERSYQDQRWGSLADHPHEVGAWLTLLRRELREAEDAWCSGSGDAGALEEILQVVTVGVACLEQHGIIERFASIVASRRAAAPADRTE